MLHPRQHIPDLAELLSQLGVDHIVISPGSRNAPLINAFYKRFGKSCISIVDERSAGYAAIGLARSSGKPAVIISTSGTAVLNYAPALAEAYYQHIPVIAITADRPEEWIDQQDNQTIRQNGVFRNFIKESFTMPETTQSQGGIDLAHSITKNAYRQATQGHPGPVHINVPLDEPLYDDLPEASEISTEPDLQLLDEPVPELDELIAEWQTSKQIMIVLGQNSLDIQLNDILKKLMDTGKVLIVAEGIANFYHAENIFSPDLFLAYSNTDYLNAPDLVIYSGGQVVSKTFKQYLRSLEKTKFWRLGPDDYLIDTFKKENKVVALPANMAYEMLLNSPPAIAEDDFVSDWKKTWAKALTLRDEKLAGYDFCDIKATQFVIDHLPEDCMLELGNSSCIRYAQLLNPKEDVVYYSNRGVSGIDGCLSTAVGTALATEKTVVALLGDLSFIYDSNGMWNKLLPPNLKIIVLNNSGGGIFDLIVGPSKRETFEDFFLAHHPVQIQKLVEAFDLNYFCAENTEELTALYPDFIKDDQKASVLEIKTIRETNTQVYISLLNRR